MTLKEFIDNYGFVYENDISLIKDFLIKCNLETEAMSMISDLAYSKAKKDDHFFACMRGNINMLAMNNYRAYYPEELADLLQRASLLLAIGEDISKYDELWGELKEKIPKHKIGTILWCELRDFLHKNGVYFKGEKNNA